MDKKKPLVELKYLPISIVLLIKHYEHIFDQLITISFGKSACITNIFQQSNTNENYSTAHHILLIIIYKIINNP